MPVATAQLASIMGCDVATAERYAIHVNEALVRAEITGIRLPHFLCQVGHESLGLTQMEEFASGKAYEGRLDLGNNQPGDGVRYRGHGAIMCTGKDNHRAYGIWMGVGDLFVREPMLIVTNPRFAIMTAPWCWITHRLNPVVDGDNGSLVEVTLIKKGAEKKIGVNGALRRATKIINGGTTGIEDRQRRFVIAKKALGIVS